MLGMSGTYGAWCVRCQVCLGVLGVLRVACVWVVVCESACVWGRCPHASPVSADEGQHYFA